MLLFSFLCQSRIWKIPCDIFVLHEMTTYRIKGKFYRAYSPLANRWPLRLGFVCFLYL